LEEQLFVYAANKKSGAMALSEVWTFTMIVSSDDSSSSRSSKSRPSFSLIPVAGVDVDQNYFKSDPDEFRAK
jgi:hypothetical protein